MNNPCAGRRCSVWTGTMLMLLAALPVLAETESCDGIRATMHDQARVDPGYLFWHQSDELKMDVDNISVLTDSAGRVVHTWPTELTGGGTPAYLIASGRILRTGIKNRQNVRGAPIASTDAVQIVGSDGSVVWELSSARFPDTVFHHDMEMLNNGNLLIVTYRKLTAAQALAIGWDPEGRDEVWADGVIEVKPDLVSGGAEIVWQWSFADHLVQDRFADKPNYGVIADHPERINPHFPESYAPMNIARQHINSVDYNEELDQILLSSFIYDEIWIINRSGDIIFRYGNPAAYGMGSDEDRVFLKQHDANWIDPGLEGAGHILVHNNNVSFRPRRPPPGQVPSQAGNNDGSNLRALERSMDNLEIDAGTSNVYELNLPRLPDGRYRREPSKPFQAEVVWLWEHPDYFADFQGSARRLPNGNTLITDTTDHHVVETTREGNIVAEYRGCTPAFKTYKYSAEQVDALLAKPKSG